MIPQDISVSSHHPYSVSTFVAGGEDTNPLSHSKISDEGFQSALESAIRDSKLFSEVVSIGGADYHLEVVITNLGQPFAGFNLSVTLTTHWKLTKRDNSQVIWQDFISTKYTATVGEHLVAVERLRIANEHAAQQNIKEGIRRLSLLSL